MNKCEKDILTKLIDIARDTNKTISMLIDNPGSKHVEEACMRVCLKVSADLGLLDKEVEKC